MSTRRHNVYMLCTAVLAILIPTYIGKQGAASAAQDAQSKATLAKDERIHDLEMKVSMLTTSDDLRAKENRELGTGIAELRGMVTTLLGRTKP